MGHGDEVYPGQIAQAAAVVAEINAVGVHSLGLGAALRQIHGRRKAKVSTLKPGPKAIAIPAPRASQSPRILASTNISVAEDMLP